MAIETILTKQRFQRFKTAGAMGVVTNTRYVRCFWPRLDKPTRLFAAGSSGIEVDGPPSPRNVIFPPDTVFLNSTNGECFYVVDNPDAEEDVERPVRVNEVVTIRGIPREVEYVEVRAVRERVRQKRPLTKAQAEAQF